MAPLQKHGRLRRTGMLTATTLAALAVVCGGTATASTVTGADGSVVTEVDLTPGAVHSHPHAGPSQIHSHPHAGPSQVHSHPVEPSK
ncbi:hypothetical protein [Streptomyces sp. cg40]|uniref:hypothetical protein n=1 Tax=Streptomyces sp. cg40 TaxID=3419764 RepID=UPI003D01B548